ncbi:Ppx/GppA phosphatase family protein [Adhaeribacter terreus]|uniref:Ppx/GppA phosphatase family protein n=1 Tax=Adhaeribacter terreus TaxID=529703 RepID=A0ABW0EEN5_9BACT
MIKFAAIDIGSNAVRCQISSVLEYNQHVTFKKVEYIRYPMRLGEDVFDTGYISAPKQEKFINFLHALKLLIEVHEVQAYQVCATSAMRTAKNASEIIQKVQEKLGMKIEVIDGVAEAELINKVILNVLDDKNYLHIDVGGGSTEFNIYVNREKVASQSFESGSIRHMQGNDSETIWTNMKRWVKENAKKYHVNRAIGTGGNINKIYDLAGKSAGKPIFKKQIEEIVEQMAVMKLEDRINIMLLNPDRADVIVPAAEIYLAAMRWSKVESMIVPSVGLKDGMMQSLYEKFVAKRNN